ncbi:MAG: NPCBM/NEW2 domain-containing protein [Phycisphaerae bacterium]
MSSAISIGSPARAAPAEIALRVIEALAVLIVGVALMNYFYAASPIRAGGPLGVPEHDSYYHIAMAEMLPTHGLLSKLPWAQYVYFREQGSDFVSHHWGFHVLLLPFVSAAKSMGFTALDGGRWAIAAVFGMNLMLFHRLLRARGVPLHWLWIALFLLLPDQFFVRHGFIRAIGPSLMFMQLTLLMLFTRRYLLAGVALAGYVHLYLGAVMYGPVIVATYAATQVIAPREDRRWPWAMVLLTALGWAVGVLTYPYASGMYEFLKLQVLGSGLSPDIEVGREWKPYTDAWFIMTIAGPLFGVWTAALLLRLRMGPRLDAEEAALMVLQFGFLLLTFKARRFIEYWPPICLLSAAYVATPVLKSWCDRLAARWDDPNDGARLVIGGGVIASLLALVCGAGYSLVSQPGSGTLMSEWALWVALAAVLALPVLTRIWTGGPGGVSYERAAIIAASGGVIIGVVVLVMQRAGMVGMPVPRVAIGYVVWVLVALAYGVVPLAVMWLRSERRAPSVGIAIGQTVAVTLAALALPTAVLASNTQRFSSIASQVRCYYDLDEMTRMMDFLKANSKAGDIVFTDDWDVFPVFFYHNRHNHYIVGLDPKFTHERDPELWNRYVKISRGQVPSTIRVTQAGGASTQAVVTLTDIRERFKARFVICDRDHRSLADALNAAPEFAECVYPSTDYSRTRSNEYVVFRVRDVGEKPAAPVAATASQGDVFLSQLKPISSSQGYGDLGANRSVDNNPIKMERRTFARGLGTHAPSKQLYEIPHGATMFEAVVGIDDETESRGSAIARVYLDGDRVYESPQLLGGNEPVVVRIPLKGAKQLLLETDATRDGNRFDHVNWADARFIVEVAATSVPASGAARP